MSDNEQPTVGETMSAKEIEFLLTCINNSTGGHLTVDIDKVAEANNFKNPKSVVNKLTSFKKKWGINIVTSKSKGVKSDVGAEASESGNGTVVAKAPAIPKATKNKVTKAKATPKKAILKKNPARGKRAAAPTKTEAPIKAAESEDEEISDTKDGQDGEVNETEAKDDH